jgi:8-oxo-dGTP diphosphatase
MNIAVTYLIVENKILLLYKEIRGYHVAPGGKVEAHETMIDTAKREFLEETGLEIEPSLAAISTIMTRDEADVVVSEYTMFTFYANEYTGTLIRTVVEGTNMWHPIDDVFTLPMFSGDQLLLQRLLAKIAERTHVDVIDYAYFSYDLAYKKLLASHITI